ncbi:MAG: carbon dioxide concentrating mechanism protein CcmL [Planctomycetaceae bacterium]|jgi:microcompartment protein CcmK/EutM|nr:carbon dioxide concentrating mechanism protein CcmL [Planctomycetaceae bacterium]
MRIGKVIGMLTLSKLHESLRGSSWRVVVPMSENNLRTGEESNAEELVVYDDLAAGDGDLIAFTEGVEAAKPFYPSYKPVDAYNAAILDKIDLQNLD